MNRARHLCAYLAACLSALLLAAPAGAAEPAAAPRTISNIATIGWDSGGRRFELPSNRVDLEVAVPSGSATLHTYRLPDGEIAPGLLSATCAAAARPSSVSAAAAAVPAPLSSYALIGTSEIIAGRHIVLALDRASANRDAQAIETIRLHVRTGTGDHEEILLVETDADSGRFVGVVLTATGAPLPGDCRLSVRANEALTIMLGDTPDGPPLAQASIDILIDPFGIAFDSRDGRPVSEVRVTLVDAATGQPALVFGDDGVSSYPSTVVTGRSVADSGGMRYDYPAGDYRFPLVRPGRYRLIVQPPEPYTAPSTASPAELAPLRRPDGQNFTLVAGSYGGEILLAGAAAVRIDLPLDRPMTPIVLAKTASRAEAEAGDPVQYRLVIRNPDAVSTTGALVVTDRLPSQMRFRTGSVRIDGVRAPDPDFVSNRELRFTLPSLTAGGETVVLYTLEVRPDARRGDALNRAQAAGPRGNLSNVADAVVRIRREGIGDRMTVLGRVVDGDCRLDPTERPGIAGVRIMLEDGSYAVTDRDGYYHFEGLMPGTHVVQLDDASLPSDRVAVDCSDNVRSGGRAFSRFVVGQGGALMRVDFHAAESAPQGRERPAGDRASRARERSRRGRRRARLAHRPGAGHRLAVPRGRAQSPGAGRARRDQARARPDRPPARRRPAGRSDRLRGRPRQRGRNGRNQPLARHPAREPDHDARRRDPRRQRRARADADPAGDLLQRRRSRHPGARALPARRRRRHPPGDRAAHDRPRRPPRPSRPRRRFRGARALLSGGRGRRPAGAPARRPRARPPGLARRGRGRHRLCRARAHHRVGHGFLRFSFRDGDSVREQRLEAWLDPGERPWTLVGLAEGTLGFNRLDRHLERLAESDDDVITDGRLALYARGRISGRWLMTLAYDSDAR